jgi:hypothetical protein
MDVALASCVDLPEPDHDEALLLEALAAAGLTAGTLAWDDPTADWSAARMTLLRATWNYPLRPRAFLAWLEATARVTDLWNRLPAVRWSFHKSYLLEMQRQGLPVAPTELVPQGSGRSLADVMSTRGWQDVVVKPAISASSYRTIRIRGPRQAEGEPHLGALVVDGDALVQRYLPGVEEYGERALIWIDGELTHAVRKSPRFHKDEESTSTALPITPAEAELASAALTAVANKVDASLMYARIDVAPGPDGEPVLMEVELIEPSLYLSQSPRALALLVSSIGNRLAASRPPHDS